MDSSRSRALRNVVGQKDFATIEQRRRETFNEVADVDPDRGGFVDRRCLTGKEIETRLLVTVLIKNRGIEGNDLPLLVETEGWARQRADPMADDTIGECREGDEPRIERPSAMEEIGNEVLLVIFDIHSRDRVAARQAASIEADVVHDAAVDAAVAVAGLHRGFANGPGGGLWAPSLATRETSLGRRKNCSSHDDFRA